MKIHDKTKVKIKKLLSMGDTFIERYNDNNNPDIIFIIGAFEDKFRKIHKEMMMSKFDAEGFHDSIYEFDNVMSSWYNNLTHQITDGQKYSNSIYDVLFSVLQGIDNLIDEDHFAWEEEDDDSEEDSIDDETYSIHDEDSDIEEDYEPDHERCFPD